ncbi:DUF2336 domain-containing protein [Phyllobacterium brassicacearum]|uniref:DUF2336 domain-containing protein n=1 Tax=Phyllobacterium brassicacearum TaxID=314235 RepID=A0A2P7BVT5_9HYPH|nr:DUF2336 domain-containing protein [Phyllobacterium brassicacearum]PSH70570.1 DUF2336 domain-containing protein [Phyllobacterium brassicacearum]TDQ35975.1 uncharacterized protein (DUF2336 family) [Phyllobacterium brassicacearum]
MKYPEFRALEDRNGGSKADDLLTASITAFCCVARPAKSDAQQLEDLAVPLLALASPRVRRHAAAALSELPHAPKRLILALAEDEVDISAPLLLRSPLLQPSDLIDIITHKGISHARAIARRRIADPELLRVLKGFNDPAIERALEIQAHFDNGDGIETPGTPTAPESPRLRETREALKALMRDSNMGFSSDQELANHLIDAALLDHTTFFEDAFAKALGLDPDGARRIIGQGLNAELTIALAALGLSSEAAHLILTGLFGLVHKDLHSLRLFVQSYRQIDQDKAQMTVERWKTAENSQKLRQKLREMAQDYEDGSRRVS